MHLLRHGNPERIRMDFSVHRPEPGDYDVEIRARGARIHVCPTPSVPWPWAYGRKFLRILQEDGPYDVVHSHVQHFSGYVLRLAHKAGVRVRIAHSHLDTSALDAQAPFARKGYLAIMKWWIARHATARIAASRQAGEALFGAGARAHGRWQVLYCGVDLGPFRAPVDRAAVRAEWGIPPAAFVLGHVGRFVEQKHHRYLIDIMAEWARRQPTAHLLLVGDGGLRPAVERQVAQRGLNGRVTFTGSRPDVARLMLGAMDAFALPSLYEGLPLVGVEAQAAGLACFFADTIAPEADLVPALVRRLPITRPPAAWAEAISAVAGKPASVRRDEALAVVARSPLNIANAIQALECVYGVGVGHPSERPFKVRGES
jgi:glycosyltransferase involved in cell wall biosynthesis